MKSRFRIGWIAKWVATGLLGIFLAGWGVSYRWHAGWGDSIQRLDANIGDGEIHVYYGGACGTVMGTQWFFNPAMEHSWGWKLPQVEITEFWISTHVPFWVLVLPSGSLAIFLWRRDRRFPEEMCQRCGYDIRASLVFGRCPECGMGKITWGTGEEADRVAEWG